MSRRAGGGRGKAKKDDLAKAAAEVLNNINVAPTPARPTTSGGLLRASGEDGDVATDIKPKHLLALSGQETSPPPTTTRQPPPLATEQGLFASRDGPPTAAAEPAGIGQTGAGLLDGIGDDGLSGGRADVVDGGGDGAGSPAGGGCAEARPSALNTPLPVPLADQPNWPPRRIAAMSHIAAAVATAAASIRDAVLAGITRLKSRGLASSYAGGDVDGESFVLAVPGGVIPVTAKAAAAVLLLLVSLLVLSASGYSLARATKRAEAALRSELADLGSGMEAALEASESLAAEVRSLRRALEARDAVQSIVQGGDGDGGGGGGKDSGSGAGLGTGVAGSLATAGGTAPVTSGELVGLEAVGGGGLDLQGLPACHVRRLAAAAGPLLAARVTRHSAVIGDEEALMRFHSLMSHVFVPEGSPRVHPLARHLTNPAVPPVCLPLAAATDAAAAASGRGAGGGGGGAGAGPFLELLLLTPANVSAVSFQYPSYGTWDTTSALLQLSATVHEAPVAGPAGGGGAVAAQPLQQSQPPPPLPLLGGIRGLRSRHVELPPLRGMECQHVTIPPPQPAPSSTASVAAGYHGGGGGGGGGSQMRVYGITLQVHSNFGNPDYSCMPRVLLHGWAA
ncbi:hypothetical protein VOLCADRAFT_86507 [Volvox carteri f. nagariensis]|uniref:Uncharacterized protein n=1 Tax=Volvox carteri f. nagariensis TaxID=3068 RepID=D8TIV0_VOLCA|nr:uncharacterized protein VOLCADRAFT_86507 [Volvox carteri f. nagariensis]EFJ52430.1 hypothetical protein VOLCADRAFT_86507 [Volvox carteri f. nagariensis]|eukprot:XP_002946503.1 hypothetical protein VOLCADRAFT_86507 [Volvox carteri f. nagariensis]